MSGFGYKSSGMMEVGGDLRAGGRGGRRTVVRWQVAKGRVKDAMEKTKNERESMQRGKGRENSPRQSSG